MFEKIDNWEVLKRPAPGAVDTNSFDTDNWTILATLDSDENIGIKIKFEELTKDEIRSRNFPEFGELIFLFQMKKIQMKHIWKLD